MGETAVQEKSSGNERIGKFNCKVLRYRQSSACWSARYIISWIRSLSDKAWGCWEMRLRISRFPISIICTATALLLGIGSASNYNLESGAGNSKKASQIVGTGLAVLIISGISIGIIVLVFFRPAFASVRRYAGRAAPCPGLYRNHRIWHSIPHSDDRRQPSDPGRQKPNLFDGLHADRGQSSIQSWILCLIFGFQWGIKGAAGGRP